MSAFILGDSKLYCKYLFDKELIEKANSQGLKLYVKATNKDFDEQFVKFMCNEVIYDWDNVFSADNYKLDFDVDYLYMLFEQNPELFSDVVRFCSKIDNFNKVA